MKINKLFILILIIFLFSTTTFSNEIEEAAKKEKKLVWYTSMLTPHAWRMLYEFQDLYPFIEVELYRATSFNVRDKYFQELEEGKVKVDVIHTADVGTFLELQSSGHLMYYESPEYKYFPEQYKSKGYWAAMRAVSVCIAYNAGRISQDDAPHSWLDIPKGKWGGRIAVGNVAEGGGTMYAQYYFLRELYGSDYWESLVKLDPVLNSGSNQIVEMLVTGEIDVTLTSLGYQIYNTSIKEGEPVRGVWPKEGVPMQPCPVAIVSEAPHPNAAKLFMDFALSLEGQTLCQAIVGCYSVREGVPALPGKIPFSEIKQPVKMDWQDYISKEEEYKAEFAKIFEKILEKNREGE